METPFECPHCGEEITEEDLNELLRKKELGVKGEVFEEIYGEQLRSIRAVQRRTSSPEGVF